jgi:hypothetical protein
MKRLCTIVYLMRKKITTSSTMFSNFFHGYKNIDKQYHCFFLFFQCTHAQKKNYTAEDRYQQFLMFSKYFIL